MQYAIDAIYAMSLIPNRRKKKNKGKDPLQPNAPNHRIIPKGGIKKRKKGGNYQTCSLTPTVRDVPPEEVCVTSNVRWIPRPMPNSKSVPSGIVPCVRSAFPEDPVSRSSLLFDDPPRQSRVSGSTWLWIVVTVTASLSGRRRFCTAASSSEPSG